MITTFHRVIATTRNEDLLRMYICHCTARSSDLDIDSLEESFYTTYCTQVCILMM